MFSLVLTQKWWLGLVAGVFGVLGVGTTLMAVPAFADAGRSPSPAVLTDVDVRLECKKGAWTNGSFTWAASGAAVGSPVALPNCPQTNGRRVVTVLNITTPGTGVATPDSFRIHVEGTSNSGGTKAVCDFPSPNLGSRELRRRHMTLTCAADGATRDSDAYMKIKVRWTGQDDDNDGASNSDNRSQNAGANGQSEDDNEEEDGPGKSKDKDKGNGNQGSSQGNIERRGWLSIFNRGRGP